MQKLKNKTALITGAARGIGAAIAKTFAAQGAEVIITDINDDEGRALASSIEAIPALDILVNNAGITGFENGELIHDPEKASLAAWHAVHAVNLDGTFMGCRYAIKAMKAKASGSIRRGGLCQLESSDPQP